MKLFQTILKPHTKKLFLSVIIVICFLIVVPSLYSNKNNTVTDLKNLSPDQVVQYYFNAINEKKNIFDLLSDGQKAITADYDSIKNIQVKSVKLISSPEYTELTQGLYAIRAYDVELEIEWEGKNKEKTSSVWKIYVGKTSEASSWKIFDIK